MPLNPVPGTHLNHMNVSDRKRRWILVKSVCLQENTGLILGERGIGFEQVLGRKLGWLTYMYSLKSHMQKL
jgi:hypothetical protein